MPTKPDHHGMTNPFLSVWWRIGAGVVAVLAGGAGVNAVFNTDNELGTAALLLIGVFLVLIAVLGRVPRVKMGGNELDPSPWVDLGGQVERSTSRSAEAPKGNQPETTMDKLLGAMTPTERMIFDLDPTGPRGREAVRQAADRIAAVSGKSIAPF